MMRSRIASNIYDIHCVFMHYHSDTEFCFGFEIPVVYYIHSATVRFFKFSANNRVVLRFLGIALVAPLPLLVYH